MKLSLATRPSSLAMGTLFAACAIIAPASAQRGPATPQADSMSRAEKFDLDGDAKKARAIFQKLIDGAADPAAKAQAQREMAISYAFTSDCSKAAQLEDQVIAYWQTREQAEPQNAFYQEGEISNEAARICFDAGDYSSAQVYYRRGSALGLKEPEPKTHPASLWDFRLTHALARIAVREGRFAEAQDLLVRARKILDGDKKNGGAARTLLPLSRGVRRVLLIGEFEARGVDVSRALLPAGNRLPRQRKRSLYVLVARRFVLKESAYGGTDDGLLPSRACPCDGSQSAVRVRARARQGLSRAATLIRWCWTGGEFP